MNYWIWITPVIPAILFWLLTRFAIDKMSMRARLMIEEFDETAAAGLINTESETAFQSISPEIETHIDHFLHTKLSKALPMLSMFIGDKTINQLKTIFMRELQEIFPSVIGKCSGQLVAAAKDKLRPLIGPVIKKELSRLSTAAFIAGLLAGFLQLFVITIIK